MKRNRLCLLAFLSLAPIFGQIESAERKIDLFETQAPETVSYLKDLEEQGYCIIPELLTAAETKLLYERVWHEFIEKAWPHCKMEDRSNWKETFPIHNTLGIFSGPAGQIQAMWDLRQDPRIVNIFANIWNTDDLIVSMDGMSIMCPTEIREGSTTPWPHVDQEINRRLDGVTHNNNPPVGFVSESSLKTAPYTIQGQFLFEESSEGDGGFYCIPNSHLAFDEFAPQLEEIAAREISPEDKKQARKQFFHDFFDLGQNSTGTVYYRKQITAPKGSLILWDSRTVHWNQHASSERPYMENPKVRMVGYLCYVPKARSTEANNNIRKEAFENGASTGHNPARCQIKYTKDHIWPGMEQYLEDPGYTQPQINLTPLGQSILGI